MPPTTASPWRPTGGVTGEVGSGLVVAGGCLAVAALDGGGSTTFWSALALASCSLGLHSVETMVARELADVALLGVLGALARAGRRGHGSQGRDGPRILNSNFEFKIQYWDFKFKI